MRAVRLRAGHASEIVDVKNELVTLQEAVGGYIETIPFPGVPGTLILVNEEGKIFKYPFNRCLANPHTGEIIDWIVGDALVVGTDGDEFADLSEADAEKIAKRTAKPTGIIWTEEGVR